MFKNKKKSLFEFAENPVVNKLEIKKIRSIKAGVKTPFWLLMAMIIESEWEKATAEEGSYRDGMNNGSNGAQR